MEEIKIRKDWLLDLMILANKVSDEKKELREINIASLLGFIRSADYIIHPY